MEHVHKSEALTEAERQVSRAERLVAYQENVVRRTAAAGKNTAEAEELLRAMVLALDRMRNERDAIANAVRH